MTESLMPFAWVAISLPILLFMQRWIHSHLHGVAYLLTGNKNWAVAIYAIVLFPGVLLHELSHWISATLLGVRTGRFSLFPQVKSDGAIQLGYVEYYKTSDLGPIRESFVGGAPLIAGTTAVILIGLHVFGISELALAIQTGDIDSLILAMGALFSANDFLVWLYLLFAISNAMMPSASDRRAWPAFLALLVGLGLILLVLGFQELLLTGLVGPVATIFGYLGLAFSLTIAVNVLFILFIALFERFLSWLKGVEIIYGGSASQ